MVLASMPGIWTTFCSKIGTEKRENPFPDVMDFFYIVYRMSFRASEAV